MEVLTNQTGCVATAYPTFIETMFTTIFDYDGSYEMQLSNGQVKMPANPGCYVVSTGCGSGKTTCCKSLIWQRNYEGILYCVDTIDELSKMYQWLCENCGLMGLTLNDIAIICSETQYAADFNEYRSNPQILMQKKVVLITHVRFSTDPVSNFLIYNPQCVEPCYDSVNELLQRSDLRQHIIFDETPQFFQPIILSRRDLAMFSERDDYGYWRCKSKDEVMQYYDEFYRPCSDNPFPLRDGSRLRTERLNMAIDKTIGNFTNWICSNRTEFQIFNSPADLSCPGMKTRVVIFEGAGDILFRGVNKFTLVDDIVCKYNCNISFEAFPFSVKRKGSLTNNTEIPDFVGYLKKMLAFNEACGKRTLVVVWKSLKADSGEEDISYYEYIKEQLLKTNVSTASYTVIYYGSSKSKSTNEFCEYTDIMLCGKWCVQATEFNRYYGTCLKPQDYQLWAFIQLISRIRVRQHNFGSCNVWYSSDFDNYFIGMLERYFNNQPIYPQVDYETDVINRRLDDADIPNNFRDKILKLADSIPKLKDDLVNGRKELLYISLAKLNQITGKKASRKRDYAYYEMYLSYVGITLKIQ